MTRTPPNDELAEISVLALLMAHGQSYRIADRLHADDFYTIKNQTIYRAILHIDNHDSTVDTNTVDSACRQIDTAWDDWSLIRQIQDQVTRSHVLNENLEHFADIVAAKSLERKYLTAAQQLEDGIYAGEMNDVSVDVFADSKFRDLGELAMRREAQITPLAMDEYETLTAPLTTISSGFKDLDKYTNGLCSPDLFVLTGESGTGKTTLAMNMVSNAAKNGHVSAIFSREMSRKQLTQRLIASEARLDLNAVKRNDAAIRSQAQEAYSRIVDNECLYIDDHSSRTVSEIKSQAMKVKHITGRLDVIVVDYLTRMRPEDPRVNRNEQVGTMARGLKSIAKQLDCCVLCLAQLNRQDDIRDSGEVNHEADVILNLKREEQQANTTKATTKKSRHAEPGSFFLTFQGHYNRFENHISAVDFGVASGEVIY